MANATDEAAGGCAARRMEASRFGVDDMEWPMLGCSIGLFPSGLEPGHCKKTHPLFKLRFLIVRMNSAQESLPDLRP